MEAANDAVDVSLESCMEVSMEASTKASREGGIFQGSFHGSCFRGTFRARSATGHASVKYVVASVEATPTSIYGSSRETNREDSVEAYSRGHFQNLSWKLPERGSSRGALHGSLSHGAVDGGSVRESLRGSCGSFHRHKQ